MNKITILFPNQLFDEHEILMQADRVILVEEQLFFKEFNFHKQKLAFHRASMKSYSMMLEERGVLVKYIESSEQKSDIRVLLADLGAGITDLELHFIDPVDDWLEQRIKKVCDSKGLSFKMYDNPSFLNSSDDLGVFFRDEKKSFFQTTFYKQQRKKRNYLLDQIGNPIGGKWSFDSENRKKYPRGKKAPIVSFPRVNEFWREAVVYVQEQFPDNPGVISGAPLYPYDHESSQAWLDQFLEFRFHEFGTYEDAIVKNETILNHSVLSPMLNVGLILPEDIIEKSINYASENDVPINSTEGFVRQIIGWREFIRGMYRVKGRYSRTRNYWGFTRKIPESFYTGTTGILPIDHTIKKVQSTAYCHHIERLMILGNFMLLCEFDPDEVYRWFMELFIDAYDWVMVPNVYGMSQFADGGLFATKPYISGSNYIKKMSDYPTGEWQGVWDGLFWRFMHVHEDFFKKNPRTGMLLHTYAKMPEAKKQLHLKRADDFLCTLD